MCHHCLAHDPLLGEGDYATIERQSLYDDHALAFCSGEVLNAWDRIGEVGKKIESFTKVIQGPKEAFMDFLQRLTSAVNRMIPNSEARQIIIKSLASKNANPLCKWIIRPLKAWSKESEIQSI